MKRILFLVNEMPKEDDIIKLSERLKKDNVETEYVIVSENDDFSEYENTNVNDGLLIATDCPFVYKFFNNINKEVLIVIHDESEFDLYPGANYFVIDPEDADYKYYDRVFRRIYELPWEMIRTRRLILRETTEADVKDFYEMYKDKRMSMYMEALYENPEEELKYVKEYRKKVYSVQGFGIWTVVRKKDGKVIGRAGLNYRSAFPEVEIGFAIGTDYWNNGYATEAILSIIKFAKKEKLGNVNALVMSENVASKHVLEKTGFVYKQNTIDGGIPYEVWCCLV